MFSSCRNSSKIGFGKMAFVSVFTVFLRGVRVVGGVTIYIYIYMHVCTYVCIYIYTHISICIRTCIFIYIHSYPGVDRI